MTEGNGDRPAGVLTPLRRNRFFYGKLMDTRHWELEQDYGIESARLINRLGLGAGILCGLGVRIGQGGVVSVEPGVAVDGCGRAIVVDQAVALERVDQPTNECAQPVGRPVRGGTVTIWLCYHECGSEYTRMANGDCGHPDQCVPGLIDERFALRIGAGLPHDRPGLTKAACTSIFPGKGGGPARREVIAKMLAGACTDPGESCVPLATVSINADGIATRIGREYRTPLYSNEELFDLLMCLAAQVDECCHKPVELPPRVIDLWPPPKGELTEDELDAFNTQKRLEIVFEREMRDLGLEQPDSWLGIWQIGDDGAARLPLTRAGGALDHLRPRRGQEAVAYDVGIDEERNGEDLAYVVMMRAAPSGAIVARDDGAALDADFGGTGLTQAERDELWRSPPSSGLQPIAVRDHVLLAAGPSLPSGDDVAGGEFHGVAARPTVVEIPPPPQMLELWPEGAEVLNPPGAPTSEDVRRFLDHPRIEFTITRAIADASLKEIGTWLRVFTTERDGGTIVAFTPVTSKFAGTATDTAGVITVTVDLAPATFQHDQQLEVLMIARPGAAPAGLAPIGEDDPHDLLDADFAGTALDKQTVLAIFDGSWTGAINDLGAVATEGATLHDGAPGGLVHSSFTVFGVEF